MVYVRDYNALCEYDLWCEWPLIRKGHTLDCYQFEMCTVTSAQQNSRKTVELASEEKNVYQCFTECVKPTYYCYKYVSVGTSLRFPWICCTTDEYVDFQ